MGLCVSLPPPPPVPAYATYASYTAAGILFSNQSVALAGVQKYWKVVKGADAVLSGFGGRKEETDKDWFHTAWREVVEELFHVKTVSITLIHELRHSFPPSDPVFMSGYVMLHYEFLDLVKALKIIQRHIPVSALYKTFPTTLNDLVTNRQPSPEAEIGALALIPTHRFKIAPEFQLDLQSQTPSP